MLRAAGLPRLTPLIIHRPRLDRWVEAYAQYPARLIIAPAGSGKTTLAIAYCTQSVRSSLYCAIPSGGTPEQWREAAAKTICAPRIPRSYDELVDAINGSPAKCRELIVDDVDNATPETLREMIQLVEDAGDNVTLIYLAKSREQIDASRLVARGVAALCDARRIAFDVQEAGMLAEACGVEATELQLRRLIEDTDGWSIAVSGTMRTAAAEGETVTRAYELWRSSSQSFLRDFVKADADRAPEECRKAFWSLYDGTGVPDDARLRELESRGLFVLDSGTERPRMYRPLRPGGARPAASPALETPPLMVRMFRSFEAKIDGCNVSWVRKRDQQIIKYLLLQPNGTASRAELASVFWTDADRHLATQSVRTACSTIRRAFASVVGPANVDRYFRTAPEIQIDVNHVVCDVRRFCGHMKDGDSEFDSGNVQDAAMHYRAADKLYAGRLLDFDGTEAWICEHANLLHELYVHAVGRLATLALDARDLDAAREYLRRAHAAAPNHPGIEALTARLKVLAAPSRVQIRHSLHRVS